MMATNGIRHEAKRWGLRKKWRAIGTGLAAAVVFCTTYALVLPAFTLERQEETLNCTLDVHRHTESCYADGEAGKILACGQADYVVHSHNEKCYDAQGGLVCPLPEIEEHKHNEKCYIDAPAPQNAEGGEAAETESACEIEENEKYMQTEECYIRQSAPGAQPAGAVQTGETAQPAPPAETAGEASADAAEPAGAVGKPSADAAEPAGAAGEPSGNAEEAADAAGEPSANAEEPAESAGQVLACGKEEIVLHEHNESCYNADGALVCGLPEVKEHVHGEGCFLPADASPSGTDDAALDDPVLGIYPGEEQADGSWVAYDAPYTDPKDATVKVTVTLPDGVNVDEGRYRLFIRRVGEADYGYPQEAALNAAVRSRSDFQCYVIRWVDLQAAPDARPEEKYCPMGTFMTEGINATIKIEYLNDAAALHGPAGGRKLLVFNSISGGSELAPIADTVSDVTVSDTAYTSFTFVTRNPGPFVFISRKVDKAYITALSISGVTDGTAPFDATGDLADGTVGTVDVPGNDHGPENRVVRSYDSILYNLGVTFGPRQEGVTEQKMKLYFELTLNKSATAARFDPSQMLWLGQNYGVEYLDGNGDVVMIMAHDGKFYEPARNADGSAVRDESGFAQPSQTAVSFNGQLNGSQSGENSYKVAAAADGIVQQRLVGWAEVEAKEGENILSSNRTFTAAVTVRNADNGEVFSPHFKMWLDGNEENYGPEDISGGAGGGFKPAEPVRTNEVTADNEDGKNLAVTVSAGASFNLQLKKNGDMTYKAWFDFSTGREADKATRDELERLSKLEENHGKSNPAEFTQGGTPLDDAQRAQYENIRYGRMTCYGIAVQLYNSTDAEDADLVQKGMKGFSLPVGDINFDLKLYSTAKSGGQAVEGADSEYTAILWDYNENIPANVSYKYSYADPGRGEVTTPADGLGNGGRNLYWNGEPRSPYAKGGAPGNFLPYHDGCYYGGDWALLDGEGNRITTGGETGQAAATRQRLSQVASPAAVKGTGEDTVYHFSVSDYDFDFDKQHFPTRDAGNSGDIPGYDSYARCFSAGCFQVLSVFPRVQKVAEADISLNVEVGGLRLVTRAGQELKPAEDDETTRRQEANRNDNTKNDMIVLYAPGNLTKGNSFNGRDGKGNPPTNTTAGFLGTDYWTTSYDCSAFAGDDIWIMSYGMMASEGDYRVGSMNLLQLLDSRGLSVRNDETPALIQSWNAQYGDDPGKVTFLYAADPGFPEGYDTNRQDVLTYMNTVREEDLVYTASQPDADGYVTINGTRRKCVGVLMELRGCSLRGGEYQYLRVPVHINGEDEELVGKTVATVNTFRVWSYDLGNVSWADGAWDAEKGKNTLADYPAPGKETDNELYSGELANAQGSHYVKTEIEDGHLKKDTHTGGTLRGNSLMILGYKGYIEIGVDNKPENNLNYTQGNGETVVDYRLKSIRTELSGSTAQGERPRTTLTLTATLDCENTTGKDRISVSANSWQMQGCEADAEGKPIGSEKAFAVSSDENSPTRLGFWAEDGRFYCIEVYAKMMNEREVRFIVKNAPVGIHLPDITFQANFAEVKNLTDNAKISTRVTISGQGDNRAYNETEGNQSTATVGVILGAGTNLTKARHEAYIEQDGTITYEVTYTNSGSQTINTIYFYDLLPHNDDIRGSEFKGEVRLREFNVTYSDSAEGAADATIYYSTIEYNELYNKVRLFGGQETGSLVTGNAANVEAMLKGEDGHRSGENGNGDPFVKVLGSPDADGSFQYAEDLKHLTQTEAGRRELEELLASFTGLYAKVENLHKDQTVTMIFTVQTDGNGAGDWYKNIANSWVADLGLPPLTSNKVETGVVARRIAGTVWYDWNLNGVRDETLADETPVENVTVTLFKKDTASGQYTPCTKDVAGGEIKPVVTGADGAYTFEKLTEGDYIVAFSGEGLAPYTGATVYQQNGANDADTSDGKEIKELNAHGIDPTKYSYFICYSAGAESMTLHPLDEMGSIPLNNGAEEYARQDLGLIIAGPELPMTGGPGVQYFILGGGVLAAASLLCLLRRRRAQRK